MKTKIKLPLFDLKYDKIEKSISHHIILHDTYLIWILEAFLERHQKVGSISEGMPPERNSYCNFSLTLLKDKISCIECDFDSTCEVWILTIYYVNGNCDAKFETESEMRIVETQLQNWLLCL